MLNGQDIVVLLKLAGLGSAWTVRSLETDLGIARAGVQRSLQRLSVSGLYDLGRRRTNVSQTEEFLIHAVKYMFPPEMTGETRGMPTAWAAPPLVDELAPPADLPPVWPDPEGRVRGIALQPLHPGVPQLARRDAVLAERLCLVEAIRIGDARVRSVASQLLSTRLDDLST